MFALIFTLATFPMAMGSSLPARCLTFAGMINRPRATSLRTVSTSYPARRATTRIASVISPFRAAAICVLYELMSVSRRLIY